MRKKIGIAFMALGLICVIIAAVLLIRNLTEAKKAGDAAEDVLLKIQNIIPESPKKSGDSQESVLPEDSAEEPENADMDIINIDGRDYIGYISIPAIDIKLPVTADWDTESLKTAPCRYYGSYKTNDLVIAAHSYARHFGKISSLKIGDSIIFTDVNGNEYKYTVGDMEKLEPTATEYMINGDWDLTLYTCTRNHVQRYTVRCERVD